MNLLSILSMEVFCLKKNSSEASTKSNEVISDPSLIPSENITSTLTQQSASLVPPLASTSSGAVHHLKPKARRLETMLEKDNVTSAEILLRLKVVHFNDSKNSGGEAVRLFRLMFPDSEIVNKIKLQRTKIEYTINFSL